MTLSALYFILAIHIDTDFSYVKNLKTAQSISLVYATENNEFAFIIVFCFPKILHGDKSCQQIQRGGRFATLCFQTELLLKNSCQ